MKKIDNLLMNIYSKKDVTLKIENGDLYGTERYF
jgi:hypothetical protein